MTKTIVWISGIALAITLQPAYAQTADVPAPSPLHSAPAANPTSSLNSPSTTTTAKHGRRSHGSKQGASSTSAQPSQAN
jgi:hypothetical protein